MEDLQKSIFSKLITSKKNPMFLFNQYVTFNLFLSTIRSSQLGKQGTINALDTTKSVDFGNHLF